MTLLAPTRLRADSAAAALVCSALLAACGTASRPAPRPAPARPASPPAADRALEARAVLLLLADRRMYDERALAALLGESAPVREALAVALGRIGDPRGRSLLQGLLVDVAPAVRRAAAFALGELGAPEARRALVVAAVDDDAETGSLAVEAAGKLGAPLEQVRRALGALDAGEAARRLAPHLFRFREPLAVAAALELLAAGDPLVRRGAAYALAREPKPEGVAALRALTADPDPALRAWAARGLGIAGALDDLPRLRPLLDGAELSPAVQALRAGAALLARSEALPPLDWGERATALLGAEAAGVRLAALEAAGRFLPHPDLERALRARLAAGAPRERELALAALVAGRVSERTALVAAAAADPEPALRAAAAEASAKTGDADLARRLLADPEPRVRVAAAGALAALRETPPLAAALADPDPTVRASALEALADSPELPTAEVVRAIEEAKRDGALNDVRTAGIRIVLARAKASAAERTGAVAALAALAGDADWLVRREAARALAELGEAASEVGPVDTRRDLATYREIVLQTERPARVEVATERGDFTIELFSPEAPVTCLSFLQLARRGFFDGTLWHRVVPDFVVQGGDPRGDGWGGPGYSLRDEIHRRRFVRGAVGLALSGPDTGGSQFFVALSPQPHLDGGYTLLGRVVAGMETVDALVQGDRLLSVRELEGEGGGRAPGAGALR